MKNILYKKDYKAKLPDYLSIEIIDEMPQFHSVRKEWLELEERASDPLTYFQSYDWCEKWCRIYAPSALSFGGSIHVALIRNNGKLAAILPLAIENRKKLAKVLRFIGEPLIQYSKVLMDENLLKSDELRDCFNQIISDAKCDAIYLDHLVSGSPLHNCLDVVDCYQSNDSYTSILSLENFQTGADYFSSLSKQTRKSRKRNRRRLEELGNLRFEAIDGASPTFNEYLKIALGFKSKWLEKTGRPTQKLDDTRINQMVSQLGVDTSHASGVLAFVHFLDDAPVAIEIGFWRLGHYYSFIGSYDWEFGRFSPGKILTEDVLEYLIANDFACYDLLGNPSDYKDNISSETKPIVAFAKGKTLVGSAYASFWRPKIKPSAQQTIASLPVGIRQLIFGLAHKLAIR